MKNDKAAPTALVVYIVSIVAFLYAGVWSRLGPPPWFLWPLTTVPFVILYAWWKSER